MTIAPGTRLGPYEIVAPLGAGGMGEVYRARDPRLGREVAIKVLPQHLSANAEVRARFEREAKTVSSLNHPHICTLHDVGREGETDYLVMELVDGETLARRLTKGALPAAEVLKLGAQIADALDRAHRAGVIHRDLKPGNVMLTKAGAKLMDFGLARATGLAGPGGGSGVTQAAMTQSPTVAAPLTAEGTIVGTFQYMSPEQLEGGEADARSDIWALGCVLYEMATGRRAFEGKSQASLIGAIMNAAPRPLGLLAPLAPPALERLVTRCLARDPDERWQSARDLGLELASVAADSAAGRSGAVLPRRGALAGPWLPWALLLVLLAAGGGYVLRPKSPGADARVVSAILAPPRMSFSIASGPMALSPDGRQIAFVAEDSTGVSSIWVRSLDAAEPRALAGTEGAQSPFWSPDGRDLGFFAEGQLRRISLSGGSSQALAPVLLPLGGAWSRDGFILYVGSRSGGVQRVAATGGESTCLVDTSRNATVRELAWPAVLPGGRHFLFTTAGGTVWRGVKDGVYAAPLDRREKPRLLLPGATSAIYSKPGRLFFWRDGALWAQAFDAGRLRFSGAAIQVADRVTLDPTKFCGLFSASPDGRLVYLQGNTAGFTELSWVDRAGKDLGVLSPPGSYYAPRLSHDGRRVAVDRSDLVTDQGDIWIFDVARRLGDRLTSSPLNETAPIWSPDDSHLYWMSAVGAQASGDIHRQALGAEGAEQTVLRSDKVTRPADCTPDGRTLVFLRRDLDIGRNSSLMLLSLADGKMTPWSSSSAGEAAGRLSRDGRWIAFASDESGKSEVYVQRFPQRGEKWRVSTAGGATPVWRGDGREIFYVVQDRQVMAVPFRAEPTVEIGVPVQLFRAQLQPGGSQANYDVTADGQRFLVDRQLQAQGRTSLTLDQGWAPPR